jgi:hypothetical protein
MGEPTLRAVITKTALQMFSALPDAGAKAAVGAVPEATRQAISAATSFAWLPMHHHLAVVEPAFAQVDRAQFRAVFRRLHEALTRQPLLAPLTDGVIKVFGLEPSAFMKIAPRSFEHVVRDAGALGWTPVKDGGDVVFSDLPPEHARSVGYAEAWAGVFEHTIALCRKAGTVEVVAHAPQDRRFTLAMRWR